MTVNEDTATWVSARGAELTVANMWERGASRVAASLPVNLRAPDADSFEDVLVSGSSLNVASLEPSRLPQVRFFNERRRLVALFGYLERFGFRQSPASASWGPRLPEASLIAERFISKPPETVLKQLQGSFAVKEISLLDTITDQDYVFAKINHRCWEEVSSIGLRQVGKDYIRKMSPIDQDCIDSGFYECLALCLDRVSRKLSGTEGDTNERQLSRSGFSFGISLTGGNSSFADDVKGQGRDARMIDDIYSAVTIGTAAGLLGFFAGITDGERRWVVSDGWAPKALFWAGQFGRFIKKIVETSDAILFIVPPWLSGITLAETEKVRVFKLIVPGDKIDTMWGLVAPIALERIAALSSQYRLTVLSQGSATSAIIGMMAHLHLKKKKHLSPFRFYDLGQLLDLANFGRADAGYWLSRADVKSHASKTNDWSHLLWNS